MRPECHVRLTPRMEEALHELQGLITARFPQAAFVVEEGFDPYRDLPSDDSRHRRH